MLNSVDIYRCVSVQQRHEIPVKWIVPQSWWRNLLYRLAHQLLVWSGGKPYADTFREEVQRLTYDSESIIEKLNLSQRDIARIWGQEIKHIVIGDDMLRKLEFGLREQYGYLGIPVTALLSRHGKARVFGMTLHLVPWLSGIALLPDLQEKPMPSDAVHYPSEPVYHER